MEILGVGMSEFVFILIIAILILGPKDMQKAGRTIGKWMRSVVTSDGWKIFQQTSRELRTLPNKLMREANEELNPINSRVGNEIQGASPSVPARSRPLPPASAPSKKEVTIQTPGSKEKEDESDRQSNA